MDQNDPRATFRADQAEAEHTERTREETAWALNIRNGEAQALQAEAHAAHVQARADFWLALEKVLVLAWLVGLSIAVWVGAGYVIRAIAEAL